MVEGLRQRRRERLGRESRYSGVRSVGEQHGIARRGRRDVQSHLDRALGIRMRDLTATEQQELDGTAVNVRASFDQLGGERSRMAARVERHLAH